MFSSCVSLLECLGELLGFVAILSDTFPTRDKSGLVATRTSQDIPTRPLLPMFIKQYVFHRGLSSFRFGTSTTHSVRGVVTAYGSVPADIRQRRELERRCFLLAVGLLRQFTGASTAYARYYRISWHIF